MSYRSNRIALCALAAAASLALASSVQAKLIGTSFDPIGTASWSGKGTFFVPDSPSPCLGLSDFVLHSVNPGSEGCSGVSLISVSVTVTDAGGSASLSLLAPSSDISDIVLDHTTPQILVGVNTGQIALDVTGCGGDLCPYEWAIEWHTALVGDSVSNTVSLLALYCPDGPSTCTGDSILVGGAPARDVKFFPAPEPGSLALLFGALGAGWLARRRRAA